MSSFAEALTAARERKQISVRELARSLGVHRKVVQRWERGMAFPHLETIPLIEAELGTKLPLTGVPCAR